MNFLSLFSGAGGMDLGLERSGMICKGQVEIMPYALKVLRKHWKKVPKWTDIKNINPDELPNADLICAGFPCQDLSLANAKRKGLQGEKSSLFWECYRIIKAKRPKWVLLENVPGLLSCNNRDDIQIILDKLTQIGYIIDIDIKDSQEFGLAQRRKRVFIVCVKLKDLFQEKTILSKQISADLLLQQLLNLWGAIPQVSLAEKTFLNYENRIEKSAILLKKRTDLLLTTQGKPRLDKLQNIFTAIQHQFGGEQINWEQFLNVEKEMLNLNLLQKDMSEDPFIKMVIIDGWMNIGGWLSNLSEEVYCRQKLFTTLITTKRIIDWKIYTFAILILCTIKFIHRYMSWSKSCWNTILSISILLKENINYATKTSNDLFAENKLRNCWRDYLISASSFKEKFERSVRKIRESEILFEQEGGSRNDKKKPEIRQGRICVFNTIKARDGQANSPGESYVVNTITAKSYGDKGWANRNEWNSVVASTIGQSQNPDPNYETHFIAQTINQGKRGNSSFVWQDTYIAETNAGGKRKVARFPRGLDSCRGIVIGNAVSVNVAEWIGKRIIDYVKTK